MSSYTLSARVPASFEPTLERVRAGLSEVGFGVITEIDMSATMKAKLDVEMPAQVILGACRPVLAHQALQADPSVAAMLPCNVVVRSVDDTTTVVETFDPAFMAHLGGAALAEVAADAGERLHTLLALISQED